MAKPNTSPRPLFDTLEHVIALYLRSQDPLDKNATHLWMQQCFAGTDTLLPDFAGAEFVLVLHFLYSYRGSLDTFNSYRRELERFICWCWFVKETSVTKLKRLDIEAFIEFCKKPPQRWIGIKTVARFHVRDAERIPNPEWRPFIAKVSKVAFKDGKIPDKKQFKLSNTGMKQIFAVLGSFYQFLIQEEVTEINPLQQIRQKSKFLRKETDTKQIRRLSDLQWLTVLDVTKQLADDNPEAYERHLFILQCLHSMYLRISELAASERWTPKMGDFFRDANNDWWFKTIGKGNKFRQIAVKPAMIDALQRYRKHLGLSTMPSPYESTPLIEKVNSPGNPITSTRPIREIVQQCFDLAIGRLKKEEKHEDAEMLRSATVHWLRHTGISDDVKVRPREHVRDDAGHSSSATTDRYIDVELKARAASAKKI
jgi:site-specific recombinase XerD